MSQLTPDSRQQPSAPAKKEPPLFREAALQYKKVNYFGKVIVIAPISFACWTISLVTVAAAILTFIIFGEYSHHRSAPGVLIPNHGLINIYPKNPGVVTNCLIKHGEKVTQNQLLYLVSTEQHGPTTQGTTAEVVSTIQKQIALQRQKLESYRAHAVKYRELFEQKHISSLEYQHYQNAYLDAEIALRDAESRLINIQAQGSHAILSPTAGTITTLVASLGDRVTPDRPLATLVPTGAKLQAMLFISPRDIGFIKMGQRILLKYDPFPYQSFGMHGATIISIDSSALAAKDLDLPIPPSQIPGESYLGGNRSFYRAIAELDKQQVTAYGQPHPLAPGMTLLGEFKGERRKLWQHILEPIYSLRGSL